MNARCVEVRLGGGDGKRIEFPVFPPNAVSSRTARLKWMFPPGDRMGNLVPDFVLPHHPEPVPEGPLFERADEDRIRCKTDLPLMALAVLCRWEEVQSSERDEYGRFPAAASLAFQEGFLQRPIVDEYGLGLEQALKMLCPGWTPSRRELRLKLSHDIDGTGIPFQFRTALGATLRRRRPLETFLWFLSLVPAVDPPPLRTVDRIVELSLERGLDSAFYWMAAKPSPYDTGYSLLEPRVQKRILRFRERDVEMGIHPSYFSFGDPLMLRNEVNEWRSVIGKKPIGGRQHYLRWLPTTWNDWDNAGLSYDSSVGYADCIGFRAGTCIPYRPWSLAEDRPLSLLEIPLLVMDGTLVVYMQLKKEEGLVQVRDLAERCRMVGGVFTFLCHTDWITEPAFGERFYLSLVEAIGAQVTFDWFGDLTRQRQVAHPAISEFRDADGVAS
jgi:hypothetical protein